MTAIVVDASVVVKWLVPEVHSDAAVSVLAADSELQAPELLLAEVGNILWKKHRAKELSGEEADLALLALAAAPVTLHPHKPLLAAAFQIARAHDRTVYDSLYLALARSLDGTFLTADERLVNALRGSELEANVEWLGDFATTEEK